jgi:hypothetical protein
MARFPHVGLLAALLVTASDVATPAANAQPLTPGNLLVSNLGTGVLREYTPSGSLVRSWNFPDFSGGFFDLRDIAVGPSGEVHAFNGTFTPQLSTLVPTTGVISSQPFTGWSTVNNISYGGVGVAAGGVFVTDMATAGAGSPQGIVRFSLTGGATTRFGTAQSYQDLTIGADGFLYALRTAVVLDVFDPGSLAPVRTVTVTGAASGADLRGIAVGSDGTIYAAGWNGSVYSVSGLGATLNSRVTGFNNLTDIDIDPAGMLVVGSRFGNIILTDISLASQTSFDWPGSPTIHVAFTTPIPEPSSAMLVALGLCASAAAKWSRRRPRHTE